MRINIRSNGRYLDISITDGGTTIDLGLMDEGEARSFADTLQEAIDEVFDSFPKTSDGESVGIEGLVKEYSLTASSGQRMRAALTELAAGYEQRIRQLEADKAEYDRRIVAVGGVAINSVSREYHDAEVARLNAIYESAVKGRQDFREAYRRQLEVERVPEGWQLVPVEPTDDMALAAIKASIRNPAINGVHIYRAMLAAAPQQKKEGE